MSGSKPLVPGSKINYLTDQLDISAVLCGTKAYSMQFKKKGKLCPEASGHYPRRCRPLPQLSDLCTGSCGVTYPVSSPREVAPNCDGASRGWKRRFHDAPHERVDQGWRHFSPLLYFIQNLHERNVLFYQGLSLKT